MRTIGLTTPEAEALAQREDDHQRWADDGGAPADMRRPDRPARVPVTDGLTVNQSGLPVRLVYRCLSAT
jgi:hypothetical protein